MQGSVLTEFLGSRREENVEDEARLARRAIEGDGAAFATLYDRHEKRVFNLCYRITASRDDAADATQESFLKVLERLPRLGDRELNFGAYLMTAARNASYDAIARRNRATPAEIAESAAPVGAPDDPDGPDRPALREVHQEEIRAANESLPPRQREVLALRELEELSYDEIAELLEMNRNSVAQLISRARINLRAALERTALESLPAVSAECERALPLIAMRHDGELEDADDAAWLGGHLACCAACRARAEAVEEAGVAYRLWLPLVPALVLRGETIAKAAERLGHDWSDVPQRGAAPQTAGRRSGRMAAGVTALVIALAVVGLVMADRAESPSSVAPPAVLPDAAARDAQPPRTAPARGRPAERPAGALEPAGTGDDAPDTRIPPPAPEGSTGRRRSPDAPRQPDATRPDSTPPDSTPPEPRPSPTAPLPLRTPPRAGDSTPP